MTKTTQLQLAPGTTEDKASCREFFDEMAHGAV
jgi:hypothetical protein